MNSLSDDYAERMGAISTLLTREAFHARYGREPGVEFWFGEVVRKGMPTSLHGILQFILMQCFKNLGYRTGGEIELRIDPEWEPRPDVIASRSPLERPYPTKPVEIVAEVLSPDDSLPLVFKKCRNYARIGISQIFVFDPEARDAWQWDRETENLQRISTLQLSEDQNLDLATVWRELDKELE